MPVHRRIRRPHPGALPVPPTSVLRDPEAKELLRVWIFGDDVATCSAELATLPSAQEWGNILFRIAMHIGRAAEEEFEGADGEKTVYAVLQGIQDAVSAGMEWDSLHSIKR